MINTERSGNGVGGGVAAAPAHDKQLPPLKKTALRDVQNENVGPVHKQQESLLPVGGRSTVDTIKVCGTKRLTPERPSSSQGLHSLAYNGTNENVMNARRRFELELGRGRLQNNVEKISDYPIPDTKIAQKIAHHVPTNNVTSPTACSFVKHSNSSSPAAKVAAVTVDPKIAGEQIRTERFIRLQKFLKQCDETNQRGYTQVLLNLSPAELSKHAVDLEKRAIQLTIEEGNEMQRMKALNIFAKSSPANNVLHSTQLLQSNKH